MMVVWWRRRGCWLGFCNGRQAEIAVAAFTEIPLLAAYHARFSNGINITAFYTLDHEFRFGLGRPCLRRSSIVKSSEKILLSKRRYRLKFFRRQRLRNLPRPVAKALPIVSEALFQSLPIAFFRNPLTFPVTNNTPMTKNSTKLQVLLLGFLLYFLASPGCAYAQGGTVRGKVSAERGKHCPVSMSS